MQIEQLRYYYKSLLIWYFLNALYHGLDVPNATLTVGNQDNDENGTFQNAAEVDSFGQGIF